MCVLLQAVARVEDVALCVLFFFGGTALTSGCGRAKRGRAFQVLRPTKERRTLCIYSAVDQSFHTLQQDTHIQYATAFVLAFYLSDLFKNKYGQLLSVACVLVIFTLKSSASLFADYSPQSKLQLRK